MHRVKIIQPLFRMEGQNFDADLKFLTQNNLGDFWLRLFDVKNIRSQERSMDDDKNFDLLLLTTFFVVALEAVEIIERDERALLQDHIKEQQRLCRSLPAEKTRPTWAGFCNRVSDRHFRWQFRMSRHAFDNLCSLFSGSHLVLDYCIK